jgi:hypothetical protein
MVVGVVHTCHTLSMHHITQQCVWSSMSIWVSLSLDHYAITEGHKSVYFSLKFSVMQKSEACEVVGLPVVLVVIHTFHTLIVDFWVIHPSYILPIPQLCLQCW